MIRVLVADDQVLVSAGLTAILSAELDMEVVAEAADGVRAVELARRLTPDVALLDIRMPTMDGIAATRLIVAGGLPTRVLIITTFDLDAYVFDAIQAGASGFLLKDAPRDQLIAAVRTVSAGDALLAPSVTRRLIERFMNQRPDAPAGWSGLGRLSGRETEVLRMIARGLSNAEIAEHLVLSTTTVKTHVASILRKLGLRDRVQAVVLAFESGLIGPRASTRNDRAQ